MVYAVKFDLDLVGLDLRLRIVVLVWFSCVLLIDCFAACGCFNSVGHYIRYS